MYPLRGGVVPFYAHRRAHWTGIFYGDAGERGCGNGIEHFAFCADRVEKRTGPAPKDVAPAIRSPDRTSGEKIGGVLANVEPESARIKADPAA